jgi:hypothetical protein
MEEGLNLVLRELTLSYQRIVFFNLQGGTRIKASKTIFMRDVSHFKKPTCTKAIKHISNLMPQSIGLR